MREKNKSWTQSKTIALLGEGVALFAVASAAEWLLAKDSPWGRWSAESFGAVWAWAAQSLMFGFGVIALVGLALMGQGIAQAKKKVWDGFGKSEEPIFPSGEKESAPQLNGSVPEPHREANRSGRVEKTASRVTA